PVIGVRSFGDDADLVARHVAAWTRGQQSQGVAACAKHFPGHGDTKADSHRMTAEVSGALDELRRTALLPFAAAAVAALAGALAATRAPARGAVRTGLLLLASAPPLGLAADPRDRWTLLAMLVPLGAGAGLALAGSLRDAAPGAALFGLTLCFPAVLTGQLIVLSLQASRLRGRLPVTETQQVQALLEGYRGWLAAAGMLAAVLAAAAVRPGLRRRNATSGARGG
ncbi:glycoside hydrolase family 3 N-terminal domain-containing protein, partial [Actinomadura sp.]|uniref:glycoside hydrolase family 3 N-terminal domain-containing protein n=1 Tax=Actinomadura sp. TaxID=1989 RepID=UPI0037CB170C